MSNPRRGKEDWRDWNWSRNSKGKGVTVMPDVSDEPLDHPYHPCFECGEPDCAKKETDMCLSCEERFCTSCQKVQRSLACLHRERRSLDEVLPCGKCDECCTCFDFDEPQTLGDA